MSRYKSNYNRSKYFMRIVKIIPIVIIVIGGFLLWEFWLSSRSTLVIYFGRPSDVPEYFVNDWNYLLAASLNCLRTAIISLALAWGISTALLTIGLLREGWLTRIEAVAAWSQAVPFLVTVTVFLLAERAFFEALNFRAGSGIYSLAPVTVSLIFPPLAYGAKGILRLQVQIKSLLRMWQVPVWRRIHRVYLPSAIPDVLTGLKTSATWAVGATLVSDGLLTGISRDDKTLGHLLIRPFSNVTQPGKTLTVILTATALGLAVYYIVVFLQLFIERYFFGQIVHTEETYSLQHQ